MANKCNGRQSCVQKMYLDCPEIQPEAGNYPTKPGQDLK